MAKTKYEEVVTEEVIAKTKPKPNQGGKSKKPGNKGGREKFDKKSGTRRTGYEPRVKFQTKYPMDDKTVSYQNIMSLNDTLLNIDGVLEFEKGLSVLHVLVDTDNIVESGFVQVEGSINAVVSGMLSQLGYPISQLGTTIPDLVKKIKKALSYSVEAYAFLIKMYQNQNGRLVKDKLGRYIGRALFNPDYLNDIQNIQYDTDLSIRKNVEDSYTTLPTTNFALGDKGISNSVWTKDFISKLSNIYLSSGMRTLVESMFNPIFQAPTQLGSQTTLINMWPLGTTGNDSLVVGDIGTTFDSIITRLEDLLTNDPVLVQILCYLDFEVGSAFDFNRDLKSETVILSLDPAISDFMLNHAIDPQLKQLVPVNPAAYTYGFHTIEYKYTNDMAIFEPVLESRIVAVLNTVKCRMWKYTVSILEFTDNAIITSLLPYIPNITVDNLKALISSGLSQDQATKVEAFLANKTDIQIALGLVAKWRIEVQAYFDVQGQLSVIPYGVEGSYLLPIVYAGYCAYKTSADVIMLQEQYSATSLIFGADYKAQLDAKLNALPSNLLKFNV